MGLLHRIVDAWSCFMNPAPRVNPDVTPPEERAASRAELEDIRAEIEWLNSEVRLSVRGRLPSEFSHPRRGNAGL